MDLRQHLVVFVVGLDSLWPNGLFVHIEGIPVLLDLIQGLVLVLLFWAGAFCLFPYPFLPFDDDGGPFDLPFRDFPLPLGRLGCELEDMRGIGIWLDGIATAGKNPREVRSAFS